MRFDLHIHSCLSPCASLEMSPSAIVRAAVQAGLEGVALCDHNSARNAPAFAECCAAGGLACLFGLEVCTAEEVHVLTIFDVVEQALAMTDHVYAALPARVNQPEVFGDQPVVNAREEIAELEWRMLSAPTRLTLPQVRDLTRELGGLFIASHVDRPAFSVYSQLGVLSGQEGFDGMEVTRHALLSAWAQRVWPLGLLRSSDAHRLDELGSGWSEAELASFTVAALRGALSRGGVACGGAGGRSCGPS